MGFNVSEGFGEEGKVEGFNAVPVLESSGAKFRGWRDYLFEGDAWGGYQSVRIVGRDVGGVEWSEVDGDMAW